MAILRDALWLWGTRVNALEEYGFPRSRMTIGEGLRTLGLDQAMMCGFLPPTEEEIRPVAQCRRLLWEMSFDEGFAFQRPLAPILRLHQTHPNVVGVLLDDFSTTEIRKGARPEVLARMRQALPDSLQLWVVIYSMSLEIPHSFQDDILSETLQHVDGISFWVWHARDLPHLPEWVARCHEVSGRKPMVVGLYFYDFGEQRPLTTADMEAQVQTGVRLLRTGECEGLCFLSSSVMDVGLATVEWTRQWIEQHGADPV